MDPADEQNFSDVSFRAACPRTESGSCKQLDYDARNKRPIAQCFARDDDLQALMVAADWAWSFGEFSQRYAPEEREAVTAKLGVHRHRYVPPWEWPAQQRAKAVDVVWEVKPKAGRQRSFDFAWSRRIWQCPHSSTWPARRFERKPT